LNLELFEQEKKKRQILKSTYIEKLKAIRGIGLVEMPPNTTDSVQYFVVRIDRKNFGLSRDEVYDKLKEYNVFARKYFHPLCSEYEPYKRLPSSKKCNLPVANKIRDEVLCLPLFGALEKKGAEKICDIIKAIRGKIDVVFYEKKSPRHFERIQPG